MKTVKNIIFYYPKTAYTVSLSRWTLFIFFTFNFSIFTFHSGAQGLTRNGESTSSSANFVDKNGKIGSIPVLNKNGQVFAVPGAPTIGTATAGNAQASVPFTAPASNGGSTITSYTATSTPGSITKTLTQAGSGTITVTGLTNGTAYTFTVTATNGIGTSAASSASNSVTPATIPGAPTIGTATAGDARATVTFNVPGSNGGSAITGYTVTSNPGNVTGTGSASPILVTGLTSGTAYTFTVTATNVIGTSAASSASNSVTPLSIGTSYQGGIIFYLLVSGDTGYNANVQHGLIAATTDQSTGIAWITGASYAAFGYTSPNLGTGQANTNNMKAQTGYTGGAAKVCDDYSITVNSVTYNDWYLPSEQELRLALLLKTSVNLSVWDAYWSSTEYESYSSYGAYYCYYNNGGVIYTIGINKNGQVPGNPLPSVRAIRSF